MRTPSARRAMDPWAVVTRAVQITCIAEDRAQGLLCSVHQARRPHVSVFHDAERFSDRENPLTDYHPAFQIPAHDPDLDHAGIGEVPVASTSDRKSTRLNSSHVAISYAVFCLTK